MLKASELPDNTDKLIFVGETGFEPATLWSQTRCATGLRHSPSHYAPSLIRFQ